MLPTTKSTNSYTTQLNPIAVTEHDQAHRDENDDRSRGLDHKCTVLHFAALKRSDPSSSAPQVRDLPFLLRSNDKKYEVPSQSLRELPGRSALLITLPSYQRSGSCSAELAPTPEVLCLQCYR